MTYNWNINELKRLRLLSILLMSNKKVNLFDTAISLYDLTKKTLNKEDILVKDRDDNISLEDAIAYFTDSMEWLDDDIYQLILGQFATFEDFSIFDRIEFENKLYTNEEIVSISHEIIKSMNNPRLLQVFEELIIPEKHLLKLEEYDKELETEIETVGGITLRNPYRKKGYVAVYKRNTIEDIEALVHEALHYYYVYIGYNRYKKQKVNYLSELEGAYGSIYTVRYLTKLNEYRKEALKLRRDMYNTHLYQSYIMMINHALIATIKDNKIDLKEALKMINSTLKTEDIIIYEDEIPGYFTINGYEKTMVSLSYLTALDIINSTNPYEGTKIIEDLKYNDDGILVPNLNINGITFHKDDLSNLKKEKELVHKI